MPKVCQIAFRNVGIPIQACTSAISFLMETFASRKEPPLFFWPFGSLPWIKKTNQSPTYTFFLSRRGQTGVCLLEGWLHHMYFLGVKLEENVKMPVYSCHSPLCLPIFLRVKSELFVVTHRFSLVVFLFTSPILLLSSPQTYFWPLRTSVHFEAFVNALLHPLTWLIPTSFSGFNSDTSPSGGLPHAWGQAPLGVPIAFCKDTLPVNVIACLSFLTYCCFSFFFLSPSSLSPSPSSLECILFVQHQIITGKECSPFGPHARCLSFVSLDPYTSRPAQCSGRLTVGSASMSSSPSSCLLSSAIKGTK